MIDGMFVFDSVVHMYDLSDANMRDDSAAVLKASRQHRDWFLRYMPMMPWPTVLNRLNDDGNQQFVQALSTDTMFDMVFRLAPIDMAVAQTVPIFDNFKRAFSPNEANLKLAREHPDRVKFCAGIDPIYAGPDKALEAMERCVKEDGAISFKFYNGSLENSWRCDDKDVAYPMYRKALDLGINVVQFHKGFVLGHQPYESMNPLDLERAARDFPEMTFVIHHLALPMFLEEALSLAIRFDNVHLALSGVCNIQTFAPRTVQKFVGRALMEVGVEKLLWGSEAAIVGLPAPFLQAFVDMEIPEDLRAGYGYPQITKADKAQILGLNLARMFNVDVAAKKVELAKAPVYDPVRSARMMSIIADEMEMAAR